MNISVIIVTHNGLKWIEECINSILHSKIAVSIIVIDNCSSDNTLRSLKQFSDVKIIRQNENLGFGAANNIGISYALQKGADYCFLMNQDVYLDSNTISNLIQIHIKNADYGILSPIHLNGKGNTLDENFSNYIKKNDNLLSDIILYNYKSKVYEVPFVNAAAWLVSRELFEKIGGFDPIFFHYGEDNNLCQRAIYHGFKIGIVPEVFMRHDRGNRKSIEVKEFSKKYYFNYEMYLKEFYADINFGSIKKIFKLEKKKYLLKVFFNLVNFNNVNSNGFLKQYKLIDKVYKKIKLSRGINARTGSHYLG